MVQSYMQPWLVWFGDIFTLKENLNSTILLFMHDITCVSLNIQLQTK